MDRLGGLFRSYGFIPEILEYKDTTLDKNKSRWVAQRVDGIFLSIVVVTYKRPDVLAVLMHALECQTQKGFDLLVMHDGPDMVTQRFIESHKNNWAGRLSYFQSDFRHNDYGHSLRELGLEMVGAEYILITNDDNYYAPRAIEHIEHVVKELKPDLILFDMVHSHKGCELMDTFPLGNEVDIGCIVVRRELAKNVGFGDKSFAGDFTYIKNIISSCPDIKIVKLPKVLLVHN
jgi:hypothetical protein